MTEDQSNQVTVLCINISPFTGLLREVMGGSSGEIRAMFWDQARMTIDQFGGEVQTRSRREMMVLWGKDAPAEDDTKQAVQAALQLQELMKQVCVGIAEPEIVPLKLAISSGPVVMVPDEDGELVATGSTVDLARGLLDRGEGVVLIAPEMVARAETLFDLEESMPETHNSPEPPAPGYRVLGPKSIPPTQPPTGPQLLE